MCIGQLIRVSCCCFEACFKDVFKLMRESCGLRKRQQVKVSYVFLSLLTLGTIMVVGQILPEYMGIFKSLIDCPRDKFGRMNCLEVSQIFRASLAQALFYLLMILICLTRSKCARVFNESSWCFKLFLILGIFLLLLRLENDQLSFFQVLAKWVSVIFLMYQILMMIDLFYIWGERWVAAYDNGKEYMKYVLIGTSIILKSLIIYLNIDLIHEFPCSRLFIFVNLGLILIQTALIVSGISQNGSLITSGAVGLFQTLQLWSAVHNETETECLPQPDSGEFQVRDLFLNSALILASLIYASVSKQHSQSNDQYGKQIEDEEHSSSDDSESESSYDSDKNKKKKKDQKMNSEIIRNKIRQIQAEEREKKELYRMQDYRSNVFIYFHLILAISSVYISMLLTNWGTIDLSSTTHDWTKFHPNQTSKYIKQFACVITSLFYIWTIIAPRVLTHRYFH